MKLDEAIERLNKAGLIVEDTSMYSALSGFYRYLKAKAPKTGYDLEIEGDEEYIKVKFMDNVAYVTLEQFDEDEDAMLYVEAGGEERAFYNEHTDFGPAMQFIIKQICPTNEALDILHNEGYLTEEHIAKVGSTLRIDFDKYKIVTRRALDKAVDEIGKKIAGEYTVWFPDGYEESQLKDYLREEIQKYIQENIEVLV